MRSLRSGLCVALLLPVAGCGSSPGDLGSATREQSGEQSGKADWLAAAASALPFRPKPVRSDATPTDRWLQIYNEVDGNHITQLLKELCGAAPATIGGQQVTISERYSSIGRQHFRDYYAQYMLGLGLTVNPQHYAAGTDTRAGDNVEAVLAGPSADSFVVITHYDSIGPGGQETKNPGCDDDMTGMAIELETARILAAHKQELAYTVRFVASDGEELGGLGGARAYASYIKSLSQSQPFKLVAAIDDEQSGWNCNADNLCNDHAWPAMDVFSCSRDHTYDYQQMGDTFTEIVTAYSSLKVVRGCMGANSDHYAMWEIGVPTLVYSEHSPFTNPHFDGEGGDTFPKIDADYLVSIARAGITFQATLAGIPKQ